MHIGRAEVKLMIETAEMRIAASVARIEESNRASREEMARIRDEMREIRGDIKSLRRTTLMTGISAVLAIFFGVCAMNSALLTHFTSGVEFGGRAAAEQEALRQDIQRLAHVLRGPPEDLAAPPKK